MKSLYEILKTSKLGAGAAPDFHTALMAQKMPFAKGGGAEHEYTGSVPVTFTANGQPLLDYLISGNTVQSGTPTPTTPIQPQSCGERTAQLFDKNNANIYNAYINTSHEWILSESAKTVKIQCEPNTVYTLSVSSTLSIFRIYESANENIAPTESGIALTPILRGENKTQYTFTTSSTAKVLIFQGSSSDYNMRFNSLMLNTGSTAKPFEHYGYKIPISSAGQTTPVYLGEVETTRRVKKLVLSSSQNWKLQSINSHGIANFYITITNDFLNISSVISNYFTRQITSIADTTSEGMIIALSTRTATVYIRVKSQTASTAQEFKDWLDGLSEEAAIWYILATEETGIVNEPLMKIGDYADTVSKAQAGVEIPTVKGSTTLDVETTVKPSEVYIKYKS